MSSLAINDMKEKSSQEIPEISKSEQKALFGGCPGDLIIVGGGGRFDRPRVQLV
jgi:hypothetical protein